MGKKKFDILKDENIVVRYGLGFISYLNSIEHTNMICDLRTDIFNEKDMFLPIVYSFLDKKNELESYEVEITFINGKVIRENMETYQFPNDPDDEDDDVYSLEVKETDDDEEIIDFGISSDFNDLVDHATEVEYENKVNRFIYEQLKENADIFKGCDYEESIIKLEKEGSETSYKLICMYYTLINKTDEKMRFHYKKKLAMMGNMQAMDDYQYYLDVGIGCPVNKELSQKEYFRSQYMLYRMYHY